jgi:hypothetical protein
VCLAMADNTPAAPKLTHHCDKLIDILGFRGGLRRAQGMNRRVRVVLRSVSDLIG